MAEEQPTESYRYCRISQNSNPEEPEKGSYKIHFRLYDENSHSFDDVYETIDLSKPAGKKRMSTITEQFGVTHPEELSGMSLYENSSSAPEETTTEEEDDA